MSTLLRILCCSRDDRSPRSNASSPSTTSPSSVRKKLKHNTPELSVLLLFQNIAYTGSKNYQKWFYNNFQRRDGEYGRRDRSYSLDSEVDFDECITSRGFSRTSSSSTSLDTIYESTTDDYISTYYTPLPSQLLDDFDTYAQYFQPTIRSMTFSFCGTAKLKYFITDEQLFLSLMLPRDCGLSSETTSVNGFTFSRTLFRFWEALERTPTAMDLINAIPLYRAVNIVSHYRNTYFTDFLVYKLASQDRVVDIRYLSLLPGKLHDDAFYMFLDRAVEVTVFSDRSVPVRDSRVINVCNDACCIGRLNYRRNLKRYSKQILSDLAVTTYV